MKIIKQLKKLPINDGVYLVLPNMENPFFIIPMTSKWAFKKAISLIKPKNSLGNIKKKVLAKIPFYFLKKFFSTVKIETPLQEKQQGQLILPWNQDRNNKFTLFNFNLEEVTLSKIGFNHAQGLIDNEYQCILLLSEIGKDIIPEIETYNKFDTHSVLETKFYAGAHPRNMPEEISSFFNGVYEKAPKCKLEEHPYFLKIQHAILENLEKKEAFVFKDIILYFSNLYKKEMVPITILHGDCSATNIIKFEKKSKIIDWEEGILEGAPLDLAYFRFRKKIDNGESWKIKNVVDFLVVLHYFHFQIKHDNCAVLNKFDWEGNIIKIK